jgi:hypothetical protein
MLQVLQGPGRIDFLAALTGTKAETVKQAEQIRIAMTVIDTVVHEGSHGGPVACFTGSREPHHRNTG